MKKYHLAIEYQNNDFTPLGRSSFSDNNNLIKRCELFRSDIMLYTRIWNSLSKR